MYSQEEYNERLSFPGLRRPGTACETQLSVGSNCRPRAAAACEAQGPDGGRICSGRSPTGQDRTSNKMSRLSMWRTGMAYEYYRWTVK